MATNSHHQQATTVPGLILGLPPNQAQDVPLQLMIHHVKKWITSSHQFLRQDFSRLILIPSGSSHLDNGFVSQIPSIIANSEVCKVPVS